MGPLAGLEAQSPVTARAGVGEGRGLLAPMQGLGWNPARSCHHLHVPTAGHLDEMGWWDPVPATHLSPLCTRRLSSPGPGGRPRPGTPRSAHAPGHEAAATERGTRPYDARHTHRLEPSASRGCRGRRTAGADHYKRAGSCRRARAPTQVKWRRPQERGDRPLRRAVALKRRQLVLLKSLNLVPKSEQTNGARRPYARANRQAV